MGRLGKALLHSSLLLLVVVVAAFLFLDRIVGRAVEEGGSRALGVRTDLGGVQLKLLRGSVGLSGLEIDNPEGFRGEHFLKLGHIRVEVPPMALREETVVIPNVELEDLELALEGSRQGTNYGRILRNLEPLRSGGAQTPAAEQSGGKRFVVQELVVRNVTATIEMDGLGSQLASTSLQVPEIRLRNLGSDGGLELDELIARVTGSVVQSVVGRQPELASQLTTELRGRLQTGVQRAREEIDRLGGVLRHPE